MRFRSKADLVGRIESEHAELVRLADAFGQGRFDEPGIWGDGWDIRDMLAHLTAWEQMFLRWHRDGCEGRVPALPEEGYSWRETPALNRVIRERSHGRAVADVVREFHASHEEILAVARSLSQADIFAPGRFGWTGRNALVTYLGANTASHYATAAKILRRALRGVRRGGSSRGSTTPARGRPAAARATSARRRGSTREPGGRAADRRPGSRAR